MKLVMYTRVSGKGQVKDGYGLDVQRKDCKAWAKANGHTIVKECSDPGLTGSLPAEERPGLQCALDAIAGGTADGLVAGKLDRLARALTVQEAVLAAVWQPRDRRRRAGRVFTADAGEVLRDDPDDPMRTAMRQMVGVFAELDRRMVVKRLKDGRAAKAGAGRHAVGAYPYGYRAGGEGRDRDAVPDEAEQRAVDLVGRMRRDGRSYREIIAALEAAGIAPRSGRQWYPSTVRKIALRLEEGSAEAGERQRER